jgi:hypothetical protein
LLVPLDLGESGGGRNAGALGRICHSDELARSARTAAATFLGETFAGREMSVGVAAFRQILDPGMHQ